MSVPVKPNESDHCTFRVICKKCGSENVEIEDGRAMGSEWTGPYGSLDIRCLDCKNEYVIAE